MTFRPKVLHTLSNASDISWIVSDSNASPERKGLLALSARRGGIHVKSFNIQRPTAIEFASKENTKRAATSEERVKELRLGLRGFT
jgi:hypothetical protein